MFVLQMLPAAHQRLATVGADAALAEVARLLSLEHINLAVVCDADGAMVGVITDSDIVRSITECRPTARHACIANAAAAMTHDVVSCRSGDGLSEVWSIMKKQGLRHIPVLDEEDRPIGVLYARDVLNMLFEDLQFEDREMQNYFFGIGYR